MSCSVSECHPRVSGNSSCNILKIPLDLLQGHYQKWAGLRGQHDASTIVCQMDWAYNGKQAHGGIFDRKLFRALSMNRGESSEVVEQDKSGKGCVLFHGHGSVKSVEERTKKKFRRCAK